MLSTLLSKQIITPEHFHRKQKISENSWNYIGDVSNLQELFGLYEARGGLVAKLIKEISKKSLTSVYYSYDFFSWLHQNRAGRLGNLFGVPWRYSEEGSERHGWLRGTAGHLLYLSWLPQAQQFLSAKLRKFFRASCSL